MKIFQFLVLIFFAFRLNAQKTATADSATAPVATPMPTYERINEVPPFNILLVNDSSMFAKSALLKKKKTLIIIFSPTCEHCKHATEKMVADYKKFKDINVVMASVSRYDAVKKFYDEYKLQDYPNIKVGVDADYFLGKFYEVRNYPAIFLYDRKGFFKKFFNSSYSMDDIAKEL